MTLNRILTQAPTLVVLLIASFAAASLAVPPAQAQVTIYTLQGVVYGPTYEPIEGAIVDVFNSAGAKAGTDATDAAGKYSIASLGSGKYNLSASFSPYRPQWVPVEIAGTDPTVQQNFVLQRADGSSSGPLVLKGIVKDEKSGKPLADVLIEVWSYPNYSSGDSMGMSYPVREERANTMSADDGSYSLNVQPGQINVNARLADHDTLYASFEMQASRTLDLPMRAASGQSVTITGVVTSSGGQELPDAWVSVYPEPEACGEGRPCVARAEPAMGGGSSPDGDVSFYYEPAYSPYQSVQVGPDGSYSLKTTAGRIRVSAYANDHLEDHQTVQAEAGQTRQADFELEKVPADSVHVHGRVLDQDGDPIPWAQVQLENQKWGHYNYTQTDEDGDFEFWTKPGHTLVTASAYRYYYVPCDRAQSDPAAGQEKSIAPGEPYPACDGQRERANEYYPQVLVISEGADGELLFELQRRPAPNAEIKGYVVNATSQEAIPGVVVNFYNEFTRDWGTATTDEDGSFKIKVHEGYYTIRASAEHYFDGVLNVEVRDGESKRIDVQMTPGEKRYGYGCCWAYASHDMAMGEGGGVPMKASAQGAPAMQSGSGMSVATPSMASGQEAYKGEAGGLGPYKPLADNAGGKSPNLGFAVVALALAGLILVRRRA